MLLLFLLLLLLLFLLLVQFLRGQSDLLIQLKLKLKLDDRWTTSSPA